MSKSLALSVNGRLLTTLAVLVPWVAFRARIFDQISILIAFFEFVGLIVLIVALASFNLVPDLSNKVLAFAVTIILFLSVLNHGELAGFPSYWAGFGVDVALAASTVMAAALLAWSLFRKSSKAINFIYARHNVILNFLGLAISIWTFPSIIQPMDAFLNLGDGTEKVLDEVAAWVTGSVPGVHLSWGHNTLLGLPLWPLSLIDGHGASKIVLIVLWVNLLVIAVVLITAALMRRLIPKLPFWLSISAALIAVTVSGSPINTSIFQELNYLARLLMPLLLGYALVIRTNLIGAIKLSRLWAISLLSSLVAWNNHEFGMPAALSCGVVLLFASTDVGEVKRRLTVFVSAHAAVILVGVALGLAQGGNWLSRRLGASGGALNPGEMGVHNNVGPMPPFGVVTVTLALAVVAVVAVVVLKKSPSSRTANTPSTDLTLYLGLWTVLSSIYCFYGVGQGAFRSQMYLVLMFLLITCLASMVLANEDFKGGSEEPFPAEHTVRKIFDLLPIAFLTSVMFFALLETPNGLTEWRRIQTPNTLVRNLDEWSPERFDWITTSGVLKLVAPFGGGDEVGWWFSYGHGIEIMTDVENLLGTTAFEYAFRSGKLQQSCEPLFTTSKSYIVTHESAFQYLVQCNNLKFKAVSAVNSEGLLVLEMQRFSG